MNFSQETTIRDRNCARGDEENPVLNHDCSSSSKSVETDLAAEVGDLASSSNSAIIMDKNITYQDSDETSLANTDPVDDHSLQNQSLDQQQPQHTNHRIIFWFPLVGMAVIVMLAALSVVVGKMILPEGCQLNNHTDRSYSSLGTPAETTTTTNTTTNTTMVPVSELAMTSQASTNATNNNTLWPTNPPKQQQQQQSDEDDDTLFAPDAYQWPHLVGMDGDEAKAQLEIHYPQKYDIYIIRDDAMVTMDYKVDRIRIFVNVETNIVTRTPMIG